MNAWLTWHPRDPKNGDTPWPFAWGQADSEELALCPRTLLCICAPINCLTPSSSLFPPAALPSYQHQGAPSAACIGESRTLPLSRHQLCPPLGWGGERNSKTCFCFAPLWQGWTHFWEENLLPLFHPGIGKRILNQPQWEADGACGGCYLAAKSCLTLCDPWV